MLSTRAAGRLAPPLVWLARGRSGRAGSAAVSACEDWTARLDRFDDAALDLDVMQDIERLGLGRRKGGYNPKQSSLRRRYTCSASLVGAMLTAQDQVPELPLAMVLPEIALTGRSNTGKSSLLNALCGIKPGPGTASVAARSGWTKSIQFFEICEAGYGDSVMVLTDLPGYGPLEDTPLKQRRAWSALTLSYLKRASRLRCVFVLIEAPLGITEDDHTFMATLDRLERPFHVILTKADLLSPLDLARTNALVHAEVSQHHPAYAGGDVPMCSSRTGAGIVDLWRRLVEGIQLESAGVDIRAIANELEREQSTAQRERERRPDRRRRIATAEAEDALDTASNIESHDAERGQDGQLAEGNRGAGETRLVRWAAEVRQHSSVGVDAELRAGRLRRRYKRMRGTSSL